MLWSHEALGVQVLLSEGGGVRLGAPGAGWDSLVPLVEVVATGHGREWSGERSVDSAIGARMRHQGHLLDRQDGWDRLRVRLDDPLTGLSAEVELSTRAELPVLRSRVRLRNDGTTALRIESVSTLTLGGLGAPADFDLHWADNDWLAELRWRQAPLREQLVDLDRSAGGHDGRGCFERSSRGSWSTAGSLPLGVLTERGTGRSWAWQVESSVGWRYELGERRRSAYLVLGGPDDARHHWSCLLAPGEEFTTVPAALAVVPSGGPEAAFGVLTGYRRLLRRPHPDLDALPVIYNDYMNTLMGDPSSERLLPLIEAAGRAGAEYFVIDAGWYDDDALGWWDSVGAWEAAERRFPGGLQLVLDAIRAHGMVPGLWLEPEVVGVRSPIARALPEEAFFQRGGVRVTEHGRHHLDLRHPAARAHLDAVVDRIVDDWGVGYFKFDYNINAGPGTDVDGQSPGAGLLGHHRAHLAWLESVLDRHPGLVLENCGSGGLRMDYAQLAVAQLQSTSDQENFLCYPPIAAAAPTAVTPEQSAVWAYPQPEFSDDENAFVLAGAMLGRIHLSGFLDRMTEDQQVLVAGGVAAYKAIRADLPGTLPFWPLGLPGWEDEWLALGLRGDGATYLTVWRRPAPDGAPGSAPQAARRRTLAVPHLRGLGVHARVVHPAATVGSVHWDDEHGELTVELPHAPQAVVVRIAAD
ncbi:MULTISPECIES: glycoside hydrolase family 36 protein [Streptacidiphilus]|uniref:Glycoside hydrolase family 36 protein n=1 Tax=Streptacidiphilus cavernicola TaxID=3342716 RepID=A0ABV6UNB3_9ACTN|nr:glycoside hydrolase family 36 protein [Streptacidiphilus jeojiense]